MYQALGVAEGPSGWKPQRHRGRPWQRSGPNDGAPATPVRCRAWNGRLSLIAFQKTLSEGPTAHGDDSRLLRIWSTKIGILS
jgi:hypothetical protein